MWFLRWFCWGGIGLHVRWSPFYIKVIDVEAIFIVCEFFFFCLRSYRGPNIRFDLLDFEIHFFFKRSHVDMIYNRVVATRPSGTWTWPPLSSDPFLEGWIGVASSYTKSAESRIIPKVSPDTDEERLLQSSFRFHLATMRPSPFNTNTASNTLHRNPHPQGQCQRKNENEEETARLIYRRRLRGVPSRPIWRRNAGTSWDGTTSVSRSWCRWWRIRPMVCHSWHRREWGELMWSCNHGQSDWNNRHQ